MPAQHARLSPSASERWLSCPASVQAVEALPRDERNQESTYAHEGTVAHSLGELEASREFGLIDDATYVRRHRKWRKDALASGLTVQQVDDMAEHIEGYVDLLRSRLDEHPYSQLFLEQRLDTGVPSCWGTSDAVIVSTTHVEIVDLKYGQGVAVSALGNPQLRLYGLGALDTFGDLLGETETVRVTIFQPRTHNTSSEEMQADDLRRWRSRILPVAVSALDGTGSFGPSEEACRWCPLAGKCRAQIEWATARDFAQPPAELSPAELGEALLMAPAIKQWLSALEEVALRTAYSDQKPIPGWKVVLSGGTRVIADQDRAVASFLEAGVDPDGLFTAPRLRGLGELEELLKSLPKIKPEGASRARYRRLEDVLDEDTLGRSPGRPSLVAESDPRPAIDPNTEAQKEFQQ